MKTIIKMLLSLSLCLLFLTGCCLSHEWIDADCETAKTCSKCGETEGNALGHSWENATCVTAKVCSTCGLTEGVALGHSYGDWEEVADGSAKSICPGCGDFKTMSAEDWAANQFIVGEWHGFASGMSTDYFRKLTDTSAEEFALTFHEDGTVDIICTLFKEKQQRGTWSFQPVGEVISPASYRFALELEDGTVTVLNASFYKTAFGIKNVDENQIALALDIGEDLSIVVFHEKVD